MSSGVSNKRNLRDLMHAAGYADDEDNTAAYSPNLSDISREIQRRIRALKTYQLEGNQLESKFYERVHELEMEFQPLFNAIYEKRKKLVTGEYEPNDNECNMPLVYGLSASELEKLENNAPIESKDYPSKGVPQFWFHALQNSSQISEMIMEHDVPILKYLFDITTEVHNNPTGFSLLFHFHENPFFKNSVLKKYYELKLTLDEENPLSYDGPIVVKCSGTQIDWKQDQNVTQKIVKKKQNKGKFVTKTVSNDSFFNFFDPTLKELNEHDDEECQDLLRTDFEVGQLIRDQIVPRAVLFYTGELADDEDDFYDQEDIGDESDSQNDDDSETDH